MNDPRLNPCDEARWAASNGFAFLDLTVEGPHADLDHLDVPELQTILNDTGLGLVGHTAWYLPFASPVARVRQAAVESVVDTFETFATLGAKWVNVHITSTPALFTHQDRLRWNGESFAQLAERAAPYGLGVMVEHPPDADLRVLDIRRILKADARLGFHLDVGHAFVGGDRLEGLLKSLKSRMVHVHLSDNRLRRDDHMPLGAGRIGWPRVIQLIQKTGYDDTITLEVFSTDPDYVLLSASKVREWWEQAREALEQEAAQQAADQQEGAEAEAEAEEEEEAEEAREAEEPEEPEGSEETEEA